MVNILYQNKGVGSKIVCDTCVYLKELGYKKIRVGVDKENPQSNYFWSKNGFKIISEKKIQRYGISFVNFYFNLTGFDY